MKEKVRFLGLDVHVYLQSRFEVSQVIKTRPWAPGGTKRAVVQSGGLVEGAIPLPGDESAICNAGFL